MDLHLSALQKLSGVMRKAILQYEMIQPGDRIAVGISGGKDSVALLAGLAALRQYMGVPYEMVAVTLDPCFQGTPTDFSPIEELCRQLDVPFVLKETEIGKIIFEIRREENPCSLCARMRRGILHDTARAEGCNKIALGHHRDDALETFIMNLFQEGRLGCFSPVTYLSRKDITMIRPLVLAEEKEVASAVRRAGLPVVKSVCPADGVTQREWTKNWLAEMELEHQGLKKRMFGALQRSHLSGW